MKTVQKNNLGRHCPSCEVGRLHTIFKSNDIDGIQYGDDYIECDECDYSEKINAKKNKKHIVEIE